MKLKLYFLLLFLTSMSLWAQSNYYWVGGSGNWNDLNHWRIGSSAGQQATIIPSRYDNVFFTNSSGFTAAGGTITAASAICKDFTVDDNFSGKISFSQNSTLNIYGHVKWRGNVGGLSNFSMNLISDGSNSGPNIIDIPGNLMEPGSNMYTASINFLGNGSLSLVNDFNSNGQFSFTISDAAVLNTNNKNITVTRSVNYSSSAVSDFGTSKISSTTFDITIGNAVTFNANANLTQATVSTTILNIPTTQNIKNILLNSPSVYSASVKTGTYLKADYITTNGTATFETTNANGQYEVNTMNLTGNTTIGSATLSNNIAKFKANTITTSNGDNTFYARENEITSFNLGSGNNKFYFGKYTVDNLTLNGGQYSFYTGSGSEFKINQNLTANLSCTGSIASFGAVNTSLYFINLTIPAGINGSSSAVFPGYKLSGVRLTGGAAVMAGIDGGSNTGNISYSGVPVAKTFYRIGGGGIWNNPSRWSLSSGGSPANCVPTMYDDVVFDANSGFAPGNNTLGNSTEVNVRNMTWSNAPGNPIYSIGTTNVYGNLYFQKDMTATIARLYFVKYNSSAPATNRNMNFEGQTITSLNVSTVNDNFYLQPATWAAPYDVVVSGDIVFNADDKVVNLISKLYANDTKIKVDGTFYLGGNTVSMNNSLVKAYKLNIATYQPITATGTSLYISDTYNGRYYTTASFNHFFESIYKEGTANTTFSTVKSNLFQINSGTITAVSDLVTDMFRVNGGNTVSFTSTATAKHFNVNTSTHFNIGALASLKVTDTFVYNRSDCDMVMNFTGNGGNNFIVGNTINGTGAVILNRMLISGINAVYVTPVAGAKPVTANNSADNGGNSGINFTVPAPKNFYWKGGTGNWADINHWSLDPSAARVTSSCGMPTFYDNVFFDQYSGFANNGSTSITLGSNIYINDMTFSGLPATAIFYFKDGQQYTVSVNGDLMLYEGMHYDDVNGSYYSMNQFSLTNTGKPANINKSVYPNGARRASLSFTGNANWKVHHGTGTFDLGDGYINQSSVVGTLDLTNTILNPRGAVFSGREVLLSGSTINSPQFSVNTQLPVNSTNSLLKMTGSLGNPLSFSANNLTHYFERIDAQLIVTSNGSNVILPNGTINTFNLLEGTFYIPPNSISLNIRNINHLNIQKRNMVQLTGSMTVHQSMLLQGDCQDADRLVISGGQLIIPAYTPANFIMNRVRLSNMSSSNGQTYVTSGSKDLGGNTGFSFPDAVTSASRNLYWVGGSGNWNDAGHWSLTSGGAPIAGCDPPRPVDNVYFDQNSGFTAGQRSVNLSEKFAYANNVTFNTDTYSPAIISNNLGSEGYGALHASGSLVLQPNTTFSNNYCVYLVQNAVPGQTRYIDGKNASVFITITASQDYFELQSDFRGGILGTNVKGFKTNNYTLNILSSTKFSFNYTQNINPVLDFGQSNVTCPDFSITNSGGNFPVTVNAGNAKFTSSSFVINVPNVNNFGEVTITAANPSTLNAGTTVHNFNKVTFLGSTNSTGTLASPGNYKTLYFNPGIYKIANGQNVTENLFMTGTPCNRISVSRTSASGQSAITLDPAAAYTMFYASVQDMNFSRPVNAFGNSQDLGNTANLTIVPTNVQAAGFGGNKTLCASEFPKIYDAATLFGTDPNASYTWTKLNAPNAGIISTSPFVTFTQSGNYSVRVVYAQDGCNITENFTITSVTLPVDNTVAAVTSAVQEPAGDVQVKFRGSLAQTYIFTYSINNGPDLEVTSFANGEAIILHPKNTAGIFVYHLKNIRFSSGYACPVPINNKDIIVNINPGCPSPGVTMLVDGILRGCTASMGARRLSELSPVSTVNPPTYAGMTQLIQGTGIVVKEGSDVLMLRNSNALPEILSLPANKPHIQGAIIYHNDHFYEGIEDGKWIRIDND